MEKGWKTSHIEYLKRRYEDLYLRWKDGGHRDDRTFFCTRYEWILEALETLPETPHLYVRVAMNHRFDEDIDTLDDIAAAFKGR